MGDTVISLVTNLVNYIREIIERIQLLVVGLMVKEPIQLLVLLG